jgi:hypothetical protein
VPRSARRLLARRLQKGETWTSPYSLRPSSASYFERSATSLALIHGQTIDAEELTPVSLESLAQVVVDPHRRKRVIQLAIVAALVEGTPTDAASRSVDALAKALDIDEAGVRVLREMAHGQAMLARFDMFRRFSRFIRNVDEFPGVLGAALPLLGMGGDPAVAARYRALEACEKGTLGRELFDYFERNQFKFPGEPGGLPAIFHDVGHVMSGYGTDPHGEIQQAAFQAGFARRDGFTFLLFGILQFHLGLRITPVAKGYEGLLDVPAVLTALRRGAACRIDFTSGYNVFADKDVPLEELRRAYGVLPLLAA